MSVRCAMSRTKNTHRRGSMDLPMGVVPVAPVTLQEKPFMYTEQSR